MVASVVLPMELRYFFHPQPVFSYIAILLFTHEDRYLLNFFPHVDSDFDSYEQKQHASLIVVDQQDEQVHSLPSRDGNNKKHKNNVMKTINSY